MAEKAHSALRRFLDSEARGGLVLIGTAALALLAANSGAAGLYWELLDIGGRYAGTVSGAMNMMGSIAGASSVTVVGYLLVWTNNDWTLTFYISAGIYLIGALCWLTLDSHTPVVPAETV